MIWRLKERILERDGFQCVVTLDGKRCEARDALHACHVLPKGKHGRLRFEEDNLLSMCFYHQRIGGSDGMIVSVGFVIDSETCEHCNLKGTWEDPVLIIVAKDGEHRGHGERDAVWIHRSCLLRAVERTMKKVASERA